MWLTQGLHRAVQQTPGTVMTICGKRTRTAAEVADRVARLAGALRDLGVQDGDRVAMLALNSDRYHEYLLAVPWAGGVLNLVNIRWSAAEIAYSLEDSGTTVLLVDDTFAAMVPTLRAAYPKLTTVIHTGEGPAPEGALSYEDLIADASPAADARRGGDDLVGVFYTGGTTGFPKGVKLSHTNLIASTLGTAASGYACGPGTRLLHVAPMFHLADLAMWTMVTTLGGTHVFLPAFTPAGTAAAIAEHRITSTLLVPTMIQLLIDQPGLADYDLTSLTSVVYGASGIPQPVLERAMAALPDTSFTQAYGMTELSPVATLLSPDDHQTPELLRSAGRAAPHAEVRIVDVDDTELPRGEVGEIAVRGAHVMLGYWEKPEETAAAIRDGWMHTGDAGYMDAAGYVFVVDRIKDMIITGGENVYSAEVENALARHPAVASCTVIGVPDPDWGERVHAVVVLTPDAQVTADELRAYCKEFIAGYKSPRSVEFVDALPVSGAGKILKRELRRTRRAQ
ncbi:acyl-CoA synthetase [Amycolatopsis jejuensis]|uniref:acyl-CoA synthetase n=1 Tax=Amycolatopsis jejuensis TaxID=330084 RepID=UPI000524EB15|nr:long-chain fatty acid--CoA ligase [Amycolatopsis jejuensis]